MGVFKQQWQMVQGGDDRKLIFIVNASYNCVLFNNHDTAVVGFNGGPGHKKVSEGTRISWSALALKTLVHNDKGFICCSSARKHTYQLYH